MIDKRFLIIGHPRCGTGFMSKWFNYCYNYQIGHEIMGKDGISSWMMTVTDREYPYSNFLKGDYNFNQTFICIRHPLDAIQSIMNIENSKEARKNIWVSD